ncbi:MAG: RHS repeat-associated core domain-containing protein [Candidatus Margulisiibacteriota bacterium]
MSQNLRDPWGNEMGSTLFNQTPVRDFTGKQLDTLSNLYDFGFRYYDSLLGTWIGKDLVPPDYAAPLSLNEYLYALNSPLKFIDPDGRLFTAAERQAQLVNAQITKYGAYTQSSKGIVSDYQSGNVKNLVCNQYVALTYKLAGESSIPYDGNVNLLKKWFATGDPTTRVYLSGNISMQNLEKGDAVFMSWGGSKIPTHVEMVKDVFKVDGVVKGFMVEGAKSTASGVGERSTKFFSLESYENYMGNATILGIGQMRDKP